MSEKTQYTAEPWHECANGDCQCGQILGPDSEYICTVNDAAVRRRILACVNVCAAFSTEVLELITEVGGMQHKMAATAAVANQRDQLLAALQELIDIRCPLTGWPSHAELVEHWEDEKAEGNGEASANLQALAAIAAAKGGAA